MREGDGLRFCLSFGYNWAEELDSSEGAMLWGL